MTAQHCRIESLRRTLEFGARLEAILGRDSAAAADGIDDPEPQHSDTTRDD